MLYFVCFITLIQSIVADSLTTERCRSRGSHWIVNGTHFRSLVYKKELYAYPVCMKGYSISSSAKVRCVDGSWESPLPQCERVSNQTCEPLSPIQNGKKNCGGENILSVGKSCNFRCNEGYKLFGSTNRTCNNNLLWTGVQPKCVLEKVFRNIPISTSHLYNISSIKKSGNKPQINPCDENNGGCHHKFDFQSGSVLCSCLPGFIQNGKNCKAVANKPTSVPTNGNSRRRNQSKEFFEATPKQDTQLKLCEIDNGNCEQVCDDTRGHIICSCRSGYYQSRNGSCIAVGSKPTSVATNENSRRRNQTKEFFETTPEQDTQLKLCEIDNGNCEQVCDDTRGYIICSCRSGYYQLRNGSCIDIDECRYPTYNRCNQRCNNTRGGYICSCDPGFILQNNFDCGDIDECDRNNGGCNHICRNFPGGFDCSCSNGFHLDINKKTCIDVDECRYPTQNRCNQRCNNTRGGYICSCNPGFILKNDYECEGCRKNSYRSENDILCKECPPNSFTDSEAKVSLADCKCSSGFEGDHSSFMSCEDINECFSDNFGCSHVCINTPGAAFCSCPPGYELKADNKTCVDIDECRTKNGGCSMHCENTAGSFHCSCSDGYNLSSDNHTCIDIDECETDKGNCSDICINTPGGFYCSCSKGHLLDVEGKTCTDVRCPSVAVPHHSSLLCQYDENGKNTSKILKPNEPKSLFYSLDFPVHSNCQVKCNKGYDLNMPYKSIICQKDGSWNASVPECRASHCPPLEITEGVIVHPEICATKTVPVKQHCHFTCKPGYIITRKKRILKCKNNLTWSSEAPICKPVGTAPFIICPDDVTIDLMWNENHINITIPRPVTNGDSLDVFPDWVTMEEDLSFPSGKTDITFKVKSLNSNSTAHCTMTVSVVDKQPPIFYECPESFEVNNVSSRGAHVTWDEPIAIDNVGIKSIVINVKPNSTLTTGIHHVEYAAEDAAGNRALCSFQINVIRSFCGDLNDPENGEANCIDWLMGKLCRPACEPGYERDQDEPKFFACGDSGDWTPSDFISPCLSKCTNGTVWSVASETCIET